LTFRLTEEAIAVIRTHQAALSAVNGKEADRTEALEDLILNPPQKLSLSHIFRRKQERRENDAQGMKPLEAFTSA